MKFQNSQIPSLTYVYNDTLKQNTCFPPSNFLLKIIHTICVEIKTKLQYALQV